MENLLDDEVNFNFDVSEEDEMMQEEDRDLTNNTDDDSNVIIQHMDIREPLMKLKKILEKKLRTNFSRYDFWLQDREFLDEKLTLVEHTIQGEGMVQINLEIKAGTGSKRGRIIILDVLKPVNDEPSDEDKFDAGEENDEDEEAEEKQVESGEGAGKDCVTRWVVCTQFRKEQERLSIPMDPGQWSESNVMFWLKWAINTFKSASIDPADWILSGHQLCSISQQQFKTKVPVDPNDLFWTHLELLRKCKFVAVVQNSTVGVADTAPPSNIKQEAKVERVVPQSKDRVAGMASNGVNVVGKFPGHQLSGGVVRRKKPVTLGVARVGLANNIPDGSPGNRSGNNGQVQLWQFLLELLTDKEHREVIHWLGEEGEFKLNNPETVAQLWGARKNKPNMNYEKLSRALRYYYDGDMICKVHGKRFVYKFVCDLKELLGYSARELSRLVAEAEQRSLARVGSLL